MGSLSIVRDSGYADRLRAYKIVLDGSSIGEIRNGETKQFEISPGEHELSATIDWCRTPAVRFQSSADQNLKFQVSSNLRGVRLLWTLYYIMLATDQYLRLERVA